MELHKELIAANLQNGSSWTQFGMLALYMQGAAPTSGEELKAAIDIYDFQDIYAKCHGLQMFALAKGVAEGHAFQLTQITNRMAFKKNDFDYALTITSNNMVPADMKKASLPDRFFHCAATAPFDRLAGKNGMAGIHMLRTAPWVYFDGGSQACFCGPTQHAESQAINVVEYEWDAARNFGGVLRPFTNKHSASNGFTLTVDAWNESTQAWDNVVAAVAKAGGLGTANYLAFSKRISTKRLRIQCQYTGAWSNLNGHFPHGVVPLEVTADAPVAEAIPDIGWVVLVPFTGNNFASQSATAISSISDPSYPVPMYVARVGLAADPDAEIILSKVSGLTAADRPALPITKFLSSNLMME